MLLAVGVSRDEHGLMGAARAAGMTVVLNPEVRLLVQPTDLHLPGRAEVVLPQLVGMPGL